MRSSLSHHAKAKRFLVPASIMLATRFVTMRKPDFPGNQAQLCRVTFKLDGCANFQKLTVHKVGLVDLYVRAGPVIEKAGIFISEPFFDYCLQNFTSRFVINDDTGFNASSAALPLAMYQCRIAVFVSSSDGSSD